MPAPTDRLKLTCFRLPHQRLDLGAIQKSSLPQKNDATTTFPALAHSHSSYYPDLLSSSFLEWEFVLVFSLYMEPCYFSQRCPALFCNAALSFPGFDKR